MIALQIPPRRRQFSECSDDSFICFEAANDNLHVEVEEQNDELVICHWERNLSIVEANKTSVGVTERKVRFDPKPEVHIIRAWNFAYRSARRGPWEEYARDRVRFQMRIQRATIFMNPILNSELRKKIYVDRFHNQEDA